MSDAGEQTLYDELLRLLEEEQNACKPDKRRAFTENELKRHRYCQEKIKELVLRLVGPHQKN
jgi:hypothetical protein